MTMSRSLILMGHAAERVGTPDRRQTYAMIDTPSQPLYTRIDILWRTDLMQ
jgi:hypothetical protein